MGTENVDRDIFYEKNGDGFISPPRLTCRFREVTFSGIEAVDQFGDWLFSSDHKNDTVIAHNMKGYDGIVLSNYLVRKKPLPHHIIFSGSKIMYMIVGKDCFNHLPMSLSKLPGSFGLSEQKKVTFLIYSILKKIKIMLDHTQTKKIIHQSICPLKTVKIFYFGMMAERV